MAKTTAPTNAKALGRQNLRDQLVERICDLIATKQLLPGQSLPTEVELQHQYGVSHTVVREAIGVLDSHGLVDVRHGVGAFVNPPEAWDIAGPIGFLVRSDMAALLNWLEVRIALEVEAAALAATRASDENLMLLQQAARDVEEATGSYEGFITADIAFHVQIAQATGNPSMAKIIRPILQPLSRSLAETARLPNSVGQAIAEHRDICHHISRHDPVGAHEAMRLHLARVADEIQQLKLQ